MIPERYEDYLKAIYQISKTKKGGWVSNSEISEFLGIKAPSVSNMLYKLSDGGLIYWKPRKSLRLTAKGKEIARNIIERYNYLKNFFKKVLKLEDKILVEELCCGIEHHISLELIKKLKKLDLKN